MAPPRSAPRVTIGRPECEGSPASGAAVAGGGEPGPGGGRAAGAGLGRTAGPGGARLQRRDGGTGSWSSTCPRAVATPPSRAALGGAGQHRAGERRPGQLHRRRPEELHVEPRPPGQRAVAPGDPAGCRRDHPERSGRRPQPGTSHSCTPADPRPGRLVGRAGGAPSGHDSILVASDGNARTQPGKRGDLRVWREIKRCPTGHSAAATQLGPGPQPADWTGVGGPARGRVAGLARGDAGAGRGFGHREVLPGRRHDRARVCSWESSSGRTWCTPPGRWPGGSASAAAASSTETWRTSTSAVGRLLSVQPVPGTPPSRKLTIDRTIERRPSLYRRYIRQVVQQLDSARSGARVCTYWGFGGDLPPDWELESGEECGTGRLEDWIKS